MYKLIDLQKCLESNRQKKDLTTRQTISALESALIVAIRNDPSNPESYPEIKTTISNLNDYDTIIIGSPLWWSNMAAPLQTFLFTYGAQMSGKKIGLIVSSASSDIGGVEADAKRLIPNGRFMTPSLWIRTSQTSNCHDLTADWLEEIDYENVASSITDTGTATAGLTYNAGKISIEGDFDYVSIFSVKGNKILQTTTNGTYTENIPNRIYAAKHTTGNKSTTHKLHQELMSFSTDIICKSLFMTVATVDIIS